LANTLHRIQQPIRVVRALLVVRDFYAKSAVSVRIGGIALNSYGAPAVVDFDKHRARIGTVVWANRAYDFHFARFPVFAAAFFIAATSSSRLLYRPFTFRFSRLFIAY